MPKDIISIYDCLKITIDGEKFAVVIAPFTNARTAVFENVLKPCIKKKGFKCKRADDFKTNTNKVNDIVRNIWKSTFVLADITNLNPNVIYELGFAHAMNKEVIMIYEVNKKNIRLFTIN